MHRFWIGLLFLAAPVYAHDADILDATATPSQAGWSVSVTIAHDETGWDDYADGWRIEDSSGATLGTRILHHPHANEQPFTRSLSGVALPADIESIWIRARTSEDGWGGARYKLTLPATD